MASSTSVCLVALGVLVSVATSCQGQGREPARDRADARARATASTEGVVVIRRSGQAMLGGDVRVAAANFWEAEFTPAGGAPVKGLTAMLWFSERSGASGDRRLRVHAGQTFSAAGYAVRVLSITNEGVRLAVSAP